MMRGRGFGVGDTVMGEVKGENRKGQVYQPPSRENLVLAL